MRLSTSQDVSSLHEDQMTSSAKACGLILNASSGGGLCLMSSCSLWKRCLSRQLFPNDFCHCLAVTLGCHNIITQVSRIGTGGLFSNSCPSGLHLWSQRAINLSAISWIVGGGTSLLMKPQRLALSLAPCSRNRARSPSTSLMLELSVPLSCLFPVVSLH